MTFLAGGNSTGLDTSVRWWLLVRFAVFGSILGSAMLVYDLPFTEPSPYSVLLSVSLLSILVGLLLARFRVEKHAQLTFHSTFDLLAIFSLVSITGVASSPFSFLFVFVIAASGALLGVAGGILSAAAATILFSMTSFITPWTGIAGFENLFAEAERVQGNLLLMDLGLHAALYLFVGVINGLLSEKLHSANLTVSELERELKRLKIETRDILRNISSGIMTCDLSECILYINPAARKILGIEDENPVGMALSVLLKDRSPMFYRFIQKSLAGDMIAQKPQEFTFKLPDDQSAIIGASTSILRDRSSRKKGVTVICQDISQKKKLQEMSKKAQKMELMADLSTMLAKEIVPPISMVQNALRVHTTDPRCEPGDVKFFNDMLDQLERVGRILWDFQNFSRIKVAEWKPVVLGDVVRETFDLLKHNPEFSNAVSIRPSGDSRNSVVWGDRELLKQVFMNIFLESCKKMSGRGRIDVEYCPPTEINGLRGDLEGNGENLLVVLQENGTVFSEEDLEHLGPSYTPSCFNGNGLRLAIVDKIIKAHVGEFLFEDVKGKGTKYSIMLPVKKPV